jgi:hypothetical protein
MGPRRKKPEPAVLRTLGLFMKLTPLEEAEAMAKDDRAGHAVVVLVNVSGPKGTPSSSSPTRTAGDAAKRRGR